MRIAKPLCFAFLFVAVLLAAFHVQAVSPPSETWQPFTAANGSPQARHESGAVVVDGKIYLLGGRGTPDVQSFDPDTSTWTSHGQAPLELHHFQPVAVGDSIYIIGSFTCCYPDEPSIADIHVFNTTSHTWSVEGSMPASRVRGSAGVVVRDGIIYVLGGNTAGHSGGAVAWFDSFNPATGEWNILPDAPNARDHFSAVLVNDYLVAAAGRQTALPNPFKNAVAQTDVYDFVEQNWSSADDIPTLRAGALATMAGDDIIVAGGEINTSTTALASVEAMNVYSRKWRSLQPLNLGRHSGGGVALNGEFHVLAGSLNTGGAPETSTHETLALNELKSLDFDADGLLNNDERMFYKTDPALADTDSDSLNDGDEVNTHKSNPLLSDTDSDGIADGDEVNLWQTNPILSDSDGDGLSDKVEIVEHTTDPLKADTDSDGLNDAAELQQYMTDPANVDTDADGIHDGDEIQRGLDPLNDDTDDDGIIDGEDETPAGGELPEPNPSPTPTPTPTPGTTPSDGEITDSSSGNVSLLFLCALLVGRLSRIRLKRVNVPSKTYNN